jgi:nucleotide-binding universal stress UspA family protein
MSRFCLRRAESIQFGSQSALTCVKRLDAFSLEELLRAHEKSKRLLAGFRERLSLPASTLEFVQRGGPAETIAKVASEWGADLIVIGSHGRTGVRRVLLGSVAEGVVRSAPCPVLIARAPS